MALLLIFAGGPAFGIAIAIISSLLISEYHTLIFKEQLKALNVTYVCLNFLVLLSVSFDYYLLLPAAAALFLSGFAVMAFRNMSETLPDLLKYWGGLLYISFPFSLAVAIRNGDFTTGGEDAHIVFLIFMAIWLCDSAAYFVGKSIGKTKLAPSISPKKTVEGAVAGFLAAALAFPLLALIFPTGFGTAFNLLLGALVGIFGQAGDLFESYLKRRAGVKDSSNILPGHGGFLDRFDSFLFAVPVIAAALLLYNAYS